MSSKRDTPWDRNEHGLWCTACGYLVAQPETADEDGYQPPDNCKQCGFPDFEDGTGYFTDDDDGDDDEDFL